MFFNLIHLRPLMKRQKKKLSHNKPLNPQPAAPVASQTNGSFQAMEILT
jgi:hypothetical protein